MTPVGGPNFLHRPAQVGIRGQDNLPVTFDRLNRYSLNLVPDVSCLAAYSSIQARPYHRAGRQTWG
jgi:hypothetical protein